MNYTLDIKFKDKLWHVVLDRGYTSETITDEVLVIALAKAGRIIEELCDESDQEKLQRHSD